MNDKLSVESLRAPCFVVFFGDDACARSYAFDPRLAIFPKAITVLLEIFFRLLSGFKWAMVAQRTACAATRGAEHLNIVFHFLLPQRRGFRGNS